MPYSGFKKLTDGGMSPALAAFIGRKKYGAKAFNHAAATGTSLRGKRPLKKVRKKRA